MPVHDRQRAARAVGALVGVVWIVVNPSSATLVLGAWFAHAAGLFRRREASADVTKLRDLWAVRSVRWQRRWYAVVAIGVGLALPTAIASLWRDPWGGLLMAGFLQTGVMLKSTFGEGYHHHRFGFDSRNGVRWWRYDPSNWLIWALAKNPLVGAVRAASRTSIACALAGAAIAARAPSH